MFAIVASRGEVDGVEMERKESERVVKQDVDMIVVDESLSANESSEVWTQCNRLPKRVGIVVVVEGIGGAVSGIEVGQASERCEK